MHQPATTFPTKEKQYTACQQAIHRLCLFKVRHNHCAMQSYQYKYFLLHVWLHYQKAHDNSDFYAKKRQSWRYNRSLLRLLGESTWKFLKRGLPRRKYASRHCSPDSILEKSFQTSNSISSHAGRIPDIRVLWSRQVSIWTTLTEGMAMHLSNHRSIFPIIAHSTSLK